MKNEIKVDLDVQVILNRPRMKKAFENMARFGLPQVGFLVSTIMKKRIRRSKRASKPGEPPKSRKGRLRKAIFYQMASDRTSVVIGPRRSIFGTAGGAHERGGMYKGQVFKRRPFAGPALQSAIPAIGPKFKNTFYVM